MRNLLIFIMALSVLSCTKTEISDSYKELNEIKFEGFKMGNAIGSQGKTAYDATNETFGVYSAYSTTVSAGAITDYLINERLAYNGTNWTLDQTKYYPNDMVDMHFIGYGLLHNQTENVPTSINVAGSIPTLVYENYDVSDLSKTSVYENFAITTSTETVNVGNKTKSVVLNFTHTLSKVWFKAQSDSDTPAETDITANITEIRVVSNNVANLGYNGSYEWNNHLSSSTKTLLLNGNEAKLNKTPVDIVDEFLYVIPNQTVTIEVDYELIQNSAVVKSETKTLTVDPGSVFNMNNNITYTLTVSKTPDNAIIFGTPTIVDWDTSEKPSVDVDTL
jgi:hypothetical protein